ncbi:hypothetical protein L218DRAFT_829158, partial [Marasmius fiardii PR-910]
MQAGEVTLALRAMHSVLHISESENQIQILHASFSDFLTNKSHSMEFFIDLDRYKHSTI